MLKNIVLRAPVFSQSGYGAHSKDIAMALWNSQKFNVSILPTGWGGASTSTEGMTLKEKEALEYMCNNKLHQGVPFIFAHVGLPTEFQKIGNFNIGITAGLESDSITQEWVNSCNTMDLVIVSSNVVKDIFIRSGVTSRVEAIEEGVDISIFNDKPLVEDLFPAIDTSHNLLAIGQWLPGRFGEDRKGIGILIDTFLKTFKDDKNVGLVLKTYITNNSSVDFYRLRKLLKDTIASHDRKTANIYLVHGNLTTEQLISLYKHPRINGFVSLTSGEGWGRGIAEAIACDLPVAVTGWGGHMHYSNPRYMKLIEYSLKPVSLSAVQSGFFTPDMIWAYPNLEDAKRKMKQLIENPLSNKKNAIEYGKIFRETYNKDIVYLKLVNLLDSFKFSNDNQPKKILLEKV